MAKTAKLDLSRYRTDQIASRVAEILSVPRAIRTLFNTWGFVVLVLLITNFVLNGLGGHNWYIWIISFVYVLFITVPLGLCLGLIRVATDLLDRTELLLRLILETSVQVAHDYQKIREEGVRIPSAGEIVAHVYEHVVLPAAESAVSKSFGFLGRPLLWIYRYTIGKGVRYLIARIQSESVTEAEEIEIEQLATDAIEAIGENNSRIESILNGAMSYTQSVAGVLRRIALRPLIILFVIVSTLALLPLLILLFG
ncbi:MAG: hypothetical protein R3C11_03700 [Planctomycetaceae bacterium]